MKLEQHALRRLAAAERDLSGLRRQFAGFAKSAEEFFSGSSCIVKGISIEQLDPDLLRVRFATVVLRLRLQLEYVGSVRGGLVVVFLDEPSFGPNPRRLDGFRFDAKGEIADTQLDGIAADMRENAADVIVQLLDAALAAAVPPIN